MQNQIIFSIELKWKFFNQLRQYQIISQNIAKMVLCRRIKATDSEGWGQAGQGGGCQVFFASSSLFR